MATDQRHFDQPLSDQTAQDSFYQTAREYLEAVLRLNPTTASSHGYHRYDHLLEDFSEEILREKMKTYEDFLAGLKRIDPAALPVSAQVDHRILCNDAESSLFLLKELKPCRRDPSLYNDLIGFSMLYLTTQEDGSPAWPERFQSMLERLRKIPAFLDSTKKMLKNPSSVHTRYAIEQNQENISFFEKSLPLFFSKAPALEGKLIQANGEAAMALKNHQRFLETDLLARSNADWRLGKELWTRRLQLILQSDMKPEEIIRRAYEYLKAERQSMYEIARPMHDRLSPRCRHAEKGDALINMVIREVLREVSKRHSSVETLFSDVQRWIDKIKRHIREKDILTLPPETDNFVVERTPGFLNGLATAFFNPAPAFEPHLKKSYWISSLPKTGDPEKDQKREESFFKEYNDYGLQSLTIHEAFPGHYVQHYYAQNSPMATIYKKVFPSGTFAEGWAILCEEQMFESGYGLDDPATLLVHKKVNLRIAINAILDAMLHTSGMPDEEADRWALDLLIHQGFQEETEAIGKLRRAKVTYCQLSTYFVGYLELKDIIEEYKKLKGNRFSLKEFNEKLLSFGTIPPREVRKLLKAH